MKKTFRRKLIYLLAAIMLFSALTGCSGEEPEKKAGVSFDKIVCRYQSYPQIFDYDLPAVQYTIYADNTVILDTQYRTDYGFLGDWATEMTFSITEEQKQTIIEAIRRNKLWRVGDCSNNYIFDSSTIRINLFNENGEEISVNGGYHPTSKRFSAVENVLYDELRSIEKTNGYLFIPIQTEQPFDSCLSEFDD